ncbi:MAG: GGDEF domain-containing protein [Chloracidobacterium sp.]|nr:GGDEF domain-containing protein [Chloracidobacterium sp.]
MTNFEDQPTQGSTTRTDTFYQVVFVIAAMCSIFLAFVLANSQFSIEAKTRGFSGIMAGFLLACVGLHIWQRRHSSPHASAGSNADRTLPATEGLRALEEASEFFSGSIKKADMFRLVSSRIRQLAKFRTSALFLLDETRSHLRVAETDGPDADAIKHRTHVLSDASVGICFSRRCVEIEQSAGNDIEGIGSIVAIPLLNGVEPFGVLCLYFDENNNVSERESSLFEAIGVRAAPLVLSSIALERSLANALTDGTTDLPNERAFYLFLENQIAETQRNPEARPLTILAIDIKNFDEINQRFGHVTGDRVLSIASKIIKDNLRQMDFLSRASSDEFLVILPTASKEIAHEVIARLSTGFFGRKLKINESESVEVELYFGWAAFGTDCETPKGLVTTARSRKEQSKSSEPNKVLWFPHELVN